MSRRPTRERKSSLEPLEGRKLLATTANNNGYFVSVYTVSYSDGDVDVYARLSKNGTLVKDRIAVATADQKELTPAVSINANGRFVVAYERVFSSTDSDIYVRAFGPNGTALSSASYAFNRNTREYDPDISINNGGRFVVSYTSKYSTSDHDVRATIFTPSNSSGTSYTSTTIVPASDSAYFEEDSSVKIAENNDIAISYNQRKGGLNPDIKVYIRRANGTEKKNQTLSNTSSAEFASFIDLWTGGSTVRVGYQVGTSIFKKTINV